MHHIDLSEHFKSAVEFFQEQGKAIKLARKNIREDSHTNLLLGDPGQNSKILEP